MTDAYLYGAPAAPGATGGIGDLNAFFLLTDRPEVYNLPAAPSRGADRVRPAFGARLAPWPRSRLPRSRCFFAE